MICRTVAIGVAALALSSGSATAQNLDAIDLPLEFHNSPNIAASEARVVDWLREGNDPDTVLDSEGNTFMHYAATNLPHILREAVRRGGDCNRRNVYGATPLHFAASQERSPFNPGPEAVRILVRCEAAPDVRRRCARGGRKDEECRANPNARDRRGDTPLHAIYEGVEKSPAPPIRALGITGLKDTGGGGRADIVRTMLEEVRADPNVRNRNGDTPLMLVIRTSSPPVFSRPGHVSLFLKNDADPNTRNRAGATPLIEAVSLDSNSTNADDDPRQIIVSLLKNGADPDLRDGRGDTPLIRAAKHEDDIADEMKALLAGGADPCLRDRNGRLAYDHADEGSDGRLLLYEAGGYRDRETGLCVRDLFEAEKKEKELALDHSNRRHLQSCLAVLGFDPGPADGMFGARTRKAVRGWQTAQGRQGIAAAGYFDRIGMDAVLQACRSTAPEPLCSGKTGEGCWMEVRNRAGCYIWNPHPQPEETVSWSGPCMDGKVSGRGKAVWRFPKDGEEKWASNEQDYSAGKSTGAGHAVYRYTDGAIWEGPLRRFNGKRHGIWARLDVHEVSCLQNGQSTESIGQFPMQLCGITQLEERQLRIAKRGGALHSGPSDEYSPRRLLADGEAIYVTATIGDWLMIDGGLGFVHESGVQEAEKPKVALAEKEELKNWLAQNLTLENSSYYKQKVSFDGELMIVQFGLEYEPEWIGEKPPAAPQMYRNSYTITWSLSNMEVYLTSGLIISSLRDEVRIDNVVSTRVGDSHGWAEALYLDIRCKKIADRCIGVAGERINPLTGANERFENRRTDSLIMIRVVESRQARETWNDDRIFQKSVLALRRLFELYQSG